MIFCDPPNIFRGAGNDYNIRVMKCSKPKFKPERFIREIACVIKSETGFDPLENLSSQKRKQVESRQVFTHFIYEYTDLSLREVGLWVGSGHANVICGLKTLNNLIDTNKEFKIIFNRIETRVKLLK